MPYRVDYDEQWTRWWNRLDNSMQLRIAKKISQIKEGLPGRHLELGAGYFVEEVGQYRLAYKSFEAEGLRRFYFVGTHKEYMKWLGLE